MLEETYCKTLAGTPPFIAPEACRPKDRRYSYSADLWSLVATFIYLLTDEYPFIGPTLVGLEMFDIIYLKQDHHRLTDESVAAAYRNQLFSI